MTVRRRMHTRVPMRAPRAVALAMLLFVASAAEGRARPCANTYGGDVISATNTTCREAHYVVSTWAVRYRRDGRVNRRVDGFSCRGRNDRYEGLTITCRRRAALITFYANVPPARR